jgi:hypothetical protein
MIDGVSATAENSPRTVGAAEISDAAGRIEEWLLTAPIQSTAAPYAGGVAGWLEADGATSFTYGEITGYWLTWLSGLRRDPADIALRAAAAVGFLEATWSGAEPPPTRLYQHPAAPDWRNRAVFCFDMAMIVRGLAHAAPAVGAERCAAVAKRVLPWLTRCISEDGTLLTHVALTGGGPLPWRWSTMPGPFQMKAAAALLQAPAAWLPPPLAEAACRTIARWQGRAAEHADLHPRLYALEGGVLAGGSAAADLAGIVIPADGRITENAADPTALVRADVLAQAIRILVLVEGEAAAGAQARAALLADALLCHVNTEGAVLFRRGTGPRNVWCAMFAAQALSWLAAGTRGEAIDRTSLV